MLENIKSAIIFTTIMKKLKDELKLKLITYNKSLQVKCQVIIDHYKIIAKRYIKKDKNGNVIIYNPLNNFIHYNGGYLNGKKHGNGIENELEKRHIYNFNESLTEVNENKKPEIYFRNFEFKEELEPRILTEKGEKYELIINTYDGEYKDGKRNGKGKEYKNKSLIYEGEYKNGKRHGYGKEYEHNKLIFEGEYFNGKRWNGKFRGYEDNISKTIIEAEYKNGKIKGKEYDAKGNLLFEGEFGILGGRWNGIGKIYDIDGNLIFEGEYINGEKKESDMMIGEI